MFANIEGRSGLLRSRLSVVSLVRLLLDPLIIIGSLAAVTAYYGEPFEGPYLVLALIVFSLTFPGTLNLAERRRAMARDILLGWVIVSAILVFLGYATKYLQVFPADVVLTWFLFAPLALYAAHEGVRLSLPEILAAGNHRRTAIVVGANHLGRKLAARLQASPYHGIGMSGFFDDRNMERIGPLHDFPLHGTMGEVPEFVKSNAIDIIYIALPMASQPRIVSLIDELRDTTASIYFVPDIFLADLIQARIDHISGIPVVAVCETPFYGVNGTIKRASDIVISALILALISPLMLAIAAGVKLSSPGPVIFKQRRYGLDSKEIVVYKFRSMTVCEDSGHIAQATRDDKRVTRLGAFMRKTSLDELPQFINVLQGRMSVVGPRPHAVAHNEMYRKLIKGYMIRHKVKPGITGWAQVNGLRGETETLDKMQSRIEFDLAYLRNWSLKLDLMIILRTVWIVFKDRQAY